jgi:hypothetical protein
MTQPEAILTLQIAKPPAAVKDVVDAFNKAAALVGDTRRAATVSIMRAGGLKNTHVKLRLSSGIWSDLSLGETDANTARAAIAHMLASARETVDFAY